MKTIIQIVVAAVVIIACARGGEAAWRYYQFKDAVEQEMRFGNATSTSELHQRVVEVASQNSVDVAYEDVAVSADGGQTTVMVTYVEPIRLVPAIYTRNQQFDFAVTVRLARPLLVDEK